MLTDTLESASLSLSGNCRLPFYEVAALLLFFFFFLYLWLVSSGNQDAQRISAPGKNLVYSTQTPSTWRPIAAQRNELPAPLAAWRRYLGAQCPGGRTTGAAGMELLLHQAAEVRNPSFLILLATILSYWRRNFKISLNRMKILEL